VRFVLGRIRARSWRSELLRTDDMKEAADLLPSAHWLGRPSTSHTEIVLRP
jgi:hypothetical protein